MAVDEFLKTTRSVFEAGTNSEHSAIESAVHRHYMPGSIQFHGTIILENLVGKNPSFYKTQTIMAVPLRACYRSVL